MLRIKKNRVVLWPVTVGVPNDAGEGAVDQIKIKVSYRLATLKDIADAENDLALVEKHIVDWDAAALGKLLEEEGQPLPFSIEMLKLVCEVPYVLTALAIGLVQCSRGIAAKN